MTKLDKAVNEAKAEGYNVYAISGGLVSNRKGSYMGNALAQCRAEHPEAEVTYVIGAHRRYGTQGWEFAVVYK